MTATQTSRGSPEDTGELTKRVLEYEKTMKSLISSVKTPSDWAQLGSFVAVEEFERIGTFLEVQNWQQYTEMLTQWARSVESFETTVRRISELPGLVYYEIEERHHRGDAINVVNSMTVFEFRSDQLIRNLNVYLQQPR